MLMAAGTNAEGFLNTPSAIKHTTAPGLGGEAEGTPDPPPPTPGQGPLTAQRLHLVRRPPPQEGSVSLGALVGLQLSDVALLVLICLINIPLEEGAQL